MYHWYLPLTSHAGLIMVVLSTGKHLCGYCLLIKNRILFIVVLGCVGSLSLCGLFPHCGERGPLSSCGVQPSHCGGFSWYGAQALGPVGSSSCSTWALGLRYTGLTAPGHVWSSWIGNWTWISCIGMGILNHWTTREALFLNFECFKTLN